MTEQERAWYPVMRWLDYPLEIGLYVAWRVLWSWR
jgi:hypothetical protein